MLAYLITTFFLITFLHQLFYCLKCFFKHKWFNNAVTDYFDTFSHLIVVELYDWLNWSKINIAHFNIPDV